MRTCDASNHKGLRPEDGEYCRSHERREQNLSNSILSGCFYQVQGKCDTRKNATKAVPLGVRGMNEETTHLEKKVNTVAGMTL